MTAGPAYAGNPGLVVGAVDGGVSLNDGAGNGLGGGGLANPLICRTLGFQFVGVQIAGVAVSGTAVAVGTIVAGTPAVPITGGTTGNVLGLCNAIGPGPANGENLLSATGNVNGFDFDPGLSVVGSIDGSCRRGPGGSAGNYTRIVGAVVVSLKCNIVVTSPTGVSSTDVLDATVVAWFQPDNPAENGITNSFHHAAFVGAFVGLGQS